MASGKELGKESLVTLVAISTLGVTHFPSTAQSPGKHKHLWLSMPTLTHIMTQQKRSPSIPSTIEIAAMKDLVRDCFSFDQDARPSSRDVCKRLAKIKAAM